MKALQMLLLAISMPVIAQDHVAYILSVKGQPRIAASENLTLKTGMLLTENDSITIESGAAIRLLTRTGDIIESIRSIRIHVAADQKSRTAFVQQLFEQFKTVHAWVKEAKIKLTTSRSSGQQAVQLSYPRNTKLLASPAKLTWKAEAGSEGFDVTMRCYDNDYSLSEHTQSNEYPIPVPELEAGKKYYWTARYRDGDFTQTPPDAWFSVMTKEETEDFKKEKNLLDNIFQNETGSPAYRLIYVQLLLKHELYHEAKALLDEIPAKERPSAAYILYANVCDKMDLNREAQNALQLAQVTNP